MHLNPTIEKFYTSILDYAGLGVEEGVIFLKNEKLPPFQIEDRPVALPYLELLKNPGDKVFFHLLNESYSSPETAVFDLYKDMLVFELNLKLSSLLVSLITLGSDPQMQSMIKSSELIKLVSNIGEVDHSVVDAVLNIVKTGIRKHSESFIFDLFLKKNGSIKGTPYGAIGKINFRLYEEAKRSLESREKEYKLYGTKFRKKDLLALTSVLEAIFPNIEDTEYYAEGTDNKIFRYLNAMLKTAYLVSDRMNHIAGLLEELKLPALCADEIYSNHNWVDYLEKLYGMSAEIRLIPHQEDMSVEANRLKLDESKANKAQPYIEQQPQPYSNPQAGFNPAEVAQPQQQPQVQQPQVQQPRQLTPEEIVRGNLGANQPTYNPMMMNLLQQPMLSQPQPQLPAWLMAEQLREQMQQLNNQQQRDNQLTPEAMIQAMTGQQVNPQMNPHMQQLLAQQQQQQMNPAMQQLLQQQMLQNLLNQQNQPTGNLQLNPHFAGPVVAPWN